MLWYFAFTTIGISIFAFFLALKKFIGFPFLKIFAGTALLATAGLLSFKAGNPFSGG